MLMSASKRRVFVPVALMALALVATACGDDSEKAASTAGSGGASSAADSALGPVKEATGTPIKIGFNSEGRGANIDTSEEIDAAKAAAKYINSHLGGINGHPIEVSLVCENKQQPAVARECGNKFVQSDIAALVAGPTGTADSVVEVVSKSDLPFFNTSTSPKALSSPGSYVMINGIGALVGVAANYGKEKSFKSIAVVTIGVPAAVEPIKQIGSLVYGNAGLTPDVVPVPPSTPDQTPLIQAALAKKPDMWQIIGDTPFCTASLKAMRTLGVKQPIVIIPQCIGKGTSAQIPGGYKDLVVGAGYSLDKGAEETKVYDAVINEYSDKKVTGESAPTGYQAMLGFARALTGLQGEPTRASIKAALEKMAAPQPIPLGAGSTFQCGTKPIVIAPNVCSGDTIQGVAQEDGTVVDNKAVDVKALLTPPSK